MSNLFESLYSLYCENSNCDLKLVSEDHENIYVHSYVIAASIPKIRDTLMSPFDRVFRRTELKVAGVQSKELKLVLQFAYLDKCDLKEDVFDAFELLKVSIRLRMYKLQTLALDTFARNLNMNHAITFLTSEEKNNVFAKLAITKCELYVLNHLVYNTDDAAEKITLPTLRSFLRDDRLNAPYEELVMDIIFNWINYDRANRLNFLPQLLQLLRVGFLSPEFIDYLRELDDIANNRRVRAVLAVSVGTVQSLQNNSHITLNHLPLVLRPRIPHSVILSIGGHVLPGGNSKIVEVYDHFTEKWTEITDLFPTMMKRCYHGAERIEDFLYMIGGIDEKVQKNTVQRLNLKTLETEFMRRMIARRCYVATATLDGRLYAFGGRYDEIRRLDTCEVYDPDTNEWKLLKPMNGCHSDAGTGVINGHIYVTGGYDSVTPLRDCEMYDPLYDSWTTLPPMIYPRSSHRCVVYREYLYAIGGNNGFDRLKSMERYDPSTQTWSNLAEMQTARSSFGAAVLHDKIFVCGGHDGTRVINDVEIYDIMSDTWYPGTPMNISKCGSTLLVIDNFDFILNILNSNIERDDMSLLRDLNRARPYFHPNACEQPLPEGDTPINAPAFGPMPQNWLNEFLAVDVNNVQEDNMEVDNNDEDSDDSGFVTAEDDIISLD